MTTKTLQWFAGVVASVGFIATSSAQSSSTALPRPAIDSVALTPGDVVRITVWRKPELSGEFVVTSQGYVAHPLYREVQVAGVSLGVAEARLRTFLEKYEANPQFVIEPLLRIAVGGEVRQPNLYTVRPETSVSQAVALAGGPTERARRDQLRLVRDNREVTVDLRRVDASGAGMRVHSGDQILVERDRAVFREVVAPVIGLAGAVAAIVSVILYSSNPR
jgi:protein involved in polysaccharide export with SLBB domain